MAKPPTPRRQLELPVFVSLKVDARSSKAEAPPRPGAAPTAVAASAEDRSIYRAMSDNYFRHLK